MAIPGLDYCNNIENLHINDIFGYLPIPEGQMVSDSRSITEFKTTQAIELISPISFYKGIDKEKNIHCTIVSQGSSPEDSCSLLKEVDILSHLNHSNVLKFYEVATGRHMHDVYFVFETFDCTLSRILDVEPALLNEPSVIKQLICELFNGLVYLHQRSIAHRDIHPENIFLQESGNLKIANFRNARRVNDLDKSMNTAEFRYQPLDQLLEAELCSKSVDIWAATCIFVQLWIKRPLFKEHGRETVMKKILYLMGFPSPNVWKEFFDIPGVHYIENVHVHSYCLLPLRFSEIPDSAMQLMLAGLRYNPKHRPNAEDFVNAAYFVENPKACSADEIRTVLQRYHIEVGVSSFRRNSDAPHAGS